MSLPSLSGNRLSISLNSTEYPTMFGWTVMRIRGRSMSPALENGDFAIAKHLTREAHLSIGEIVLVDHPDLGLIVKYVMALSPSGVRLIGAASSSIDPYATGTIARDRVLSRLVWRIKPIHIHRLRGQYNCLEVDS